MCSLHFSKDTRKGISQTQDPIQNRNDFSSVGTKSTQTKQDDLVSKLQAQLKRKTTRLKLTKIQRRQQVLKFRAIQVKLRQKEKECSSLQSVLNKFWTTVEKCPVLNSLFIRLIFGTKTYDSALKSFSQSLSFYSVSAHKFVRSSLNKLIPHKRTITLWSSGLKLEPGFIEPSLDHIKSMASKNSNGEIICSLQIDEMNIRQQILSNGDKYEGFVDFGGIHMPRNKNTPATHALRIMAVGTNGYWKIPIAFYFTKGLPPRFLTKAIRESLVRLAECGVSCNCVVFDGLSSNMKTAKMLGAKFEIDNPKPYFPHPSKQELVYVILDTCHMLKLLRNLWKHFGTLRLNNKNIKWSFITELVELQGQEGLRAANRLSMRHVNFENQKMKVNLATQLFSCSTQNALRFCEDIHHPDFVGSGPTASFIEEIDRLFDALNSRNTLAKGYKAPLSAKNKRHWSSTFKQSTKILMGLQTSTGVPIHKTKRYTAIIGLICNIESIKGLMELYVTSPKPRLYYLLTYKLSQDHVETFFSCIRNVFNPNVQQFKAALRKVLVSRILPSENANATTQDDTESCLLNPNKCFIPSSNQTDSDQEEIDVNINLNSISQFSSCVVTYIAGWVVSKLKSKVACPTCLAALENNSTFNGQCDLELIQRKQNGGLVVPSVDVVKICKATESCFRSLSTTDISSFKRATVQNQVLAYVVANNIFENLRGHLLDHSFQENHIYLLSKLIV